MIRKLLCVFGFCDPEFTHLSFWGALGTCKHCGDADLYF